MCSGLIHSPPLSWLGKSDSKIICFFQESFASVPDVQLLRCADYFGRAFSAVTTAQFGWNKILRETPLAKTIEVGCSFVHLLGFVMDVLVLQKVCFLVVAFVLKFIMGPCRSLFATFPRL